MVALVTLIQEFGAKTQWREHPRGAIWISKVGPAVSIT
jgi:hypothetical protein